MLYSRCPMCGSKHEIVKVTSWPLPKEKQEVYTNCFKLCGVDVNGEMCCSYDDYHFTSREEADRVAATWGRKDLEQLDRERQDEALACYDDRGYFFDYGPVDSDLWE